MKGQIQAAIVATALLAAGTAQADILYDNGPINATINAWSIDIYAVSNSFTLSSNSLVTEVEFGVWNFPTDAIQTIDWSISATPLGTALYGGTANVTSVYQFTTASRYDISLDSFSVGGLSLGAGTYYLNLTNATSLSGQSSWDENDGPSSAEQDASGPIGSESFRIIGRVADAVPEPLTLSLAGAGLAGIGAARRRKAR